MLFEGLPTIQVLEFAFKALGHPKLAIIDNCIHQAFPYETLRKDVPFCSFHTCYDAFAPGNQVNNREQAGFMPAVLIVGVLPFLNGKDA